MLDSEQEDLLIQKVGGKLRLTSLMQKRLVELKRGSIRPEHRDQLRRYLDHAGESSLLRGHLDRGARLRGVLATVDPCEFDPKDPDISVRIVDRARVVAALVRLRPF